MDKSACHVIYVNKNVGRDGLVLAQDSSSGAANTSASTSQSDNDNVRQEVQPLLDAFGDVHVCTSGAACITKLLQLQDETMTEMKPTLVLLDTPYDERIPRQRSLSRSPSPRSGSRSSTVAEIHTPDEEVYGLNLLQKLVTEAHLRNMSKLVVPISIITYPEPIKNSQLGAGAVDPFNAPLRTLAANRQLVRRCLDLGAVDVIISPLSAKCITTLEISAYKAHRDASREQAALLEVRRGRKRSWVGVNEQKPFAYLREAMVSGLMNGICRLSSEDEQLASALIAVSSERQGVIADSVGHWHFDAHSYTDDELLVASLVMFKHALAMPELQHWRIPTDQLIGFLVACRAAYNDFVPYHNFRHVVDVLQATFHFLVHVGALPAYNNSPSPDELSSSRSPIASLLTPFEALTLLVTAIGHDVGHPGVNNGFLTTLNAPLAQLYNDRSVLESFHCAAYSQILRRYWPTVFEDRKLRNLMISSILATDMGLHFDYMKKLGDTQDTLHDENNTDAWNGRKLEESKALCCALLIKCADISNVARRYGTALSWMHILSEEFSRQASMEEELAIKSSLMAAPKKDIVSLSNAQLGFMNLFAIPLFQGVADLMPALRYTVQELETNKALFEKAVHDEKANKSAAESGSSQVRREGTLSPRTMSLAIPTSDTKETTTGSAPMNQINEGKLRGGNESEISGQQPTELLDVQRRDEQHVPLPNQDRSDVSESSSAHKDVDGISTFDAVRELAESDPFHCQNGEARSVALARGQRSSETTTEGSASGAYTGDWASQATSATTSKMPVSPSTKGTSIVSQESADHSESVPGFSVSPPSTSSSPATVKKSGGTDEESTSSGPGEDGKVLKKKPSRFRMKDFPFFRRHRASSPNYPPTDAPAG